MAAAGAYLFEPEIVDLGFYVERGKYALAGYTLIYASLLVGFAATAGALRTGNAIADYALSFVAGPIALFALGFLFAALAVDATFYRDPANTWVALLAIAAVLCFVASSLSEIAEKQAATNAGGSGDGGKPPRLVSGFLAVAFYFVVALAAVVTYINVGSLLFYLLQANLLDGSEIDLSRIGPALTAVLGEVAVERWQFVVVMGTLGALLIYAFAGFGALIAGASQKKAIPLDPQDETFVQRCARDLRAYAEARGYERDARRLLWLVVLPSMFAPMFAVIIAGVGMHDWFPRPYALAELQALGWHVYERQAGLSLVIMVFAALLWGALPNAVISRLWRSYSETAGWSGFATKQLSLETYLRLFLRTGFLSRERTFDPGAFLHRINTMYEPYFLYSAVGLSFLAAIAWHHDMSRYHVLTDKYVEVMTYWTLERQRFRYASVRLVELECVYDDGRPVAGYRITLPNTFSINLHGTPDRLADAARVDDLIPSSVPRVYAMRKPLHRDEVEAFDPFCIEELAASLPDADAGRLREIFRVEDWHRQRWKERTSAPK